MVLPDPQRVPIGKPAAAKDPPIQQLEILNEIARIATLDLELRPMMQRITDTLAGRFDWEFVALVLVDHEKSSFVCQAVTSTRPTDIHVGYSRPLGSGVVGEVAATGRAILIDDVRLHANYVETMPGTLSELCVPVLHAGKLVAILNLESTSLAAFHDQLPLLSTVADQIAGAIASAHLYDQLSARARLMEMMSEVSRTALEATDLDGLLQRVVTYIHHHIPVEIVAICTHDETAGEWIQKAHAGGLSAPIGVRRPVAHGVIGRCIRTRKTQIVPDVSRDPDYFSVNDRVTAELAVPIHFQGEIVGVLNVESATSDMLTPANVIAFEAFAAQIAGAIRVFRLNETLERLSVTDALTGCANRRQFDELLDHEWKRGLRNTSPLALLMIDIDHFKAYNDTYGHQAGDACLRDVASALRDVLQRTTDVVARYGGEEFAVIVPDTDLAKGRQLGEMIRERVESLRIEHRAAPRGAVTVSIGVAALLPEMGGGPEQLIETADVALYAAKRRGRNQVSAG